MTDHAPIPYARVAPPPVNRPRPVRLGLLSCAAGVVANGVPAYFVLSMLKLPAGAAARPMIEAAVILLGTLGGLAVGLPLGIASLVAGRRRWPGWLLGLVGCSLACSPWFVNRALWDWVVAARGLTMEP